MAASYRPQTERGAAPGQGNGAHQTTSGATIMAHAFNCAHAGGLVRPPTYGTAEWHALANEDPCRQEAMRHAAECWRWLTSSPHVTELVAEWFEWQRRATAADDSQAVSASATWSRLGPTYGELERRRSVPGQAYQDATTRRGEYTGGPVDWTTGRPRIREEVAA